MEEPKEITVRIKGEDKTMSFKHLVYDLIEASSQDPTLKALIDQARDEFVGDIESIKVTILLEV